MTRPTSEQIKALRKGDVVTVRAEVEEVDGEFFVVSVWQNSMYGVRASVTSDSIATIEPREIKVGDRVAIRAERGAHGTVRANERGKCAVLLDSGEFWMYRTENLERLT